MGSFKLILLIPFFTFSQPVNIPIINKPIDATVLHVDGSILMTVTFAQLHYNYTNHKNQPKSVLVGVLSSLFVGVVCKELIHDKWLKKGVYSNWDIADDSWGTACGIIVCIMKFDVDDNGLVSWEHKPRKSKFNKKKYILD